eukprot:RCo002633
MAEEAVAVSTASTLDPSFWGSVMVHNIKSKQNVGTILRSAVAFGFREIILYGGTKLNTFGSHVARDALPVRQFVSLKEAVAYLKSAGYSLCGVEIMPQAQPVNLQPFHGSTCFLLGNEGEGLSEAQQAVCDGFVYIPQYGT